MASTLALAYFPWVIHGPPRYSEEGLACHTWIASCTQVGDCGSRGRVTGDSATCVLEIVLNLSTCVLLLHQL